MRLKSHPLLHQCRHVGLRQIPSHNAVQNHNIGRPPSWIYENRDSRCHSVCLNQHNWLNLRPTIATTTWQCGEWAEPACLTLAAEGEPEAETAIGLRLATTVATVRVFATRNDPYLHPSRIAVIIRRQTQSSGLWRFPVLSR